jgi:Flp pilus assembly pilin Flp
MDFLQDQSGQDITEYTLLLAFVVVAAAALLLVNVNSIVGIWTASSEIVANANSAARAGVS